MALPLAPEPEDPTHVLAQGTGTRACVAYVLGCLSNAATLVNVNQP